ncbi:MAG: cytochrome c3 family protein [Parafilimonas sp.]
MRYKQTLILFSFIVILLLFVKCINKQNNTNQNISAEQSQSKNFEPINYQQFAGSVSCIKCHQSVTQDYFNTAHYFTSQPAGSKSIKGSFKNGQNSFTYDVGKVVKLEKHNDSFYQVYYYKGKKVVQRRFDIVIGSGNRGQTYLSWIGNHIIELPVSYFTQVDQWANSPGYPLSPIIFNRPVTARCLECHSTYASTINYNPDIPPAFDSAQMILTIGCERCHGPAAKHVAYETQHPNDSAGMFIIKPAKLSRQLSIDVCGICHSGRLQEKKPPFQFVAGDSLSDFFEISDAAQKAGIMDVHGNQLGVLSASKCFRLSKTMTCVTCHDPHKNETGNTLLFSQRCISCHSNQHKQIEGLSNDVLVKNCIDCHMPLQQSTSISFLLQNKTQPVNAVMRTHYITIYNDETKNFIEQNSFSKKQK